MLRALATEVTNRPEQANSDLHARYIHLGEFHVIPTGQRPGWAFRFGEALAALDQSVGDGVDAAALYTSLMLILARAKFYRVMVGVKDSEQTRGIDTRIQGTWAEIAAQAPNAVAVDEVDVVNPQDCSPA